MSSILPRFDFRAAFAQASDKGARRQSYEDAALVAPEIALFAVADGMGGHQAGEVAAKLAVDTVRKALSGREAQRAIDAYVAKADLETRRAVYAALRRAFEAANRAVLDDAAANAEHAGMGTTLDVVWLARGNAFVAHAGDGRVYLARARAMLLLTQDHSIAVDHPAGRRSAGITNAIGLGEALRVDTLFVDLGRGDRLLLCTDGVHGQVEAEAELSELVRGGTPELAAKALIARAGEHGRDNATAIVVEVGDRFVKRTDHDRGLAAADLERARQSPLLVDLPQSFALSALAAAVEVELAPGEVVPRLVTNDLVAYIVLDGVVRYAAAERSVGAGALVFPESLVGLAGQEEPPIAEQTTRLLRLRADDFAEVCADPQLAAELYRRLAAHIARVALRSR
ncbi:MAG TPA: protein phosphatase 2C domain-containing protein [Polyangiaceae bacterium]|jgi:serine/threonine protein phosphatase PrpC|nr:protein phosphatase 2C domain-containing protein [Polyangiaceae bacterium]